MRIPAKRLGPILLASLVAVGGAAQTVHARSAASPVTITVAFQQFGPPPYHEQEWLQKAKTQFEAANPNIKIKLLPIIASEGDYYTKIDLMLRSASTAPDIVREDSFLVGSDVTAGYLEPLDKYLAAWPEYKAQWFPGMQSITTFNGHNYGVMNGTDVRLIWYNKNIFRKAGLPVPWQPHSWADILSAARTLKAKIKDKGFIPFNIYSGIPMDEASTMQGFEMLLYGTPDSAHLYDYKTKKWVISSKGTLDTLKFIQQIYDPTNLLGPTNDIALSPLAWQPIQSGITKGKVGMDLDGSWVSSNWYPTGSFATPNWQQIMGYAKMPTQKGQAPHYVTLSGGWAYSISSRSANKDAAFQFLKVANSRDLLAFYDVAAGQITPRKDVVDVPAYHSTPLSPFYTSLVAFTQFRPGFPAYPRISNQIDLAMENVMSGMKPEDAMSSYAQAVTGIAGASNVETK